MAKLQLRPGAGGILGATAAALLFAATPLARASADATPIRNAEAACTAVKAHVTERDHVPLPTIAFCDVTPAANSPAGYYVIALHGRARCDGICSYNMGWFAVEKATGRLFEWDVAEMRLGSPLS